MIQKILEILENNFWYTVVTIGCIIMILWSLLCDQPPETPSDTSEVVTISSEVLMPVAEVVPIAYADEVTLEPVSESEELQEETVEETIKLDEYDVPLSEEEKQLIYDFMDIFQLDFDITNYYGMLWTESRFKNSLESYAGACGIAQIMPYTFEEYYNQFSEDFPEYCERFPSDVWNKQTNLVISLYYIRQIQEEFGLASLSTDNNFSIVATAYNRGIVGARKLYKETGSYVSEYSSLILQGAQYLREYNAFNGIE